ncbi:hypothetical protein LAZ67_15000902 [Cordylochernes scorpioides]|uniref:Tc1-like transposase DDE domain-containing protein n=1 Tax=Cordylochernes scorpioides TaxID=51811 RepID=A0ABY6L8D7_9ARAC|nr:hypothetical protein LAZ67_15000902 [Cordylochernes scorpioides]
MFYERLRFLFESTTCDYYFEWPTVNLCQHKAKDCFIRKCRDLRNKTNIPTFRYVSMKKLLENILKSWLKLLKMEDIVPIKSSMLMKQDYSELEDVTPLDEKLLREGLQLSVNFDISFNKSQQDFAYRSDFGLADHGRLQEPEPRMYATLPGCHASKRLTVGINHRRLRRLWCDEKRMWTADWNEIVFTDELRFCLQHHDGRIRVWRHRGERMLNSCVLHRHTGYAPGIAGTLNSQRYISEVLEPVVRSYLQGLPTAIFQQNNARPHVTRIVQRLLINRQIELLPWPARSPDLSPIENMWSMVVQRLTQITSPAATPDQLWQRVLGVLNPKNTSKSL